MTSKLGYSEAHLRPTDSDCEVRRVPQLQQAAAQDLTQATEIQADHQGGPATPVKQAEGSVTMANQGAAVAGGLPPGTPSLTEAQQQKLQKQQQLLRLREQQIMRLRQQHLQQKQRQQQEEEQKQQRMLLQQLQAHQAAAAEMEDHGMDGVNGSSGVFSEDEGIKTGGGEKRGRGSAGSEDDDLYDDQGSDEDDDDGDDRDDGNLSGGSNPQQSMGKGLHMRQQHSHKLQGHLAGRVPGAGAAPGGHSLGPAAASGQGSGAGGPRRRSNTDAEREHKRMKRLLRNRVSAQQARERKKQYLSELETRVSALEQRNGELEERLSTLQRENFMLRQVVKNTTPAGNA